MKRKLIAMLLTVCMVFSLAVTASAASVNDSNVFLKQATNKTCTLASATMMLRRHAIQDKDAGWSAITESAVRKVAWTSDGLLLRFTYRGMLVKAKGLASAGYKTAAQKKAYFISILKSYPEGFVAYNGNQPHAVLITDYDAATDTFYCADPSSGAAKGRIKLSASTLKGSSQDQKIANCTQIWYIASGCKSSGAGTDTSSSTSTDSSQVLQNGTYYIASALNTNYVLDLTSGSSSNGANIQLYKNSFIDNQSFTVKYLGNGYYEISSVKSGKVLDVASAGKKNGTNVQQYTRNNSDAQKWTLKDAGNGYYYVVSKCNGLYLDVTGGKVANKTNIQMYTGNSSNAQKWKFIPVSTLKIDLTRYPSSIKKGSYYGLRGTVSSNYKLVKVEGHILNSSGKDAIPASVDKPTGTSLNIQTANLNNKLTFNKLAVGTYTMKVVATDASGNSVTWSKTFKVTK